MKRIYKYPLETTDVQTVSMPIGAKILTVQTQNDKPCIWALVNPEAPTEKRNIEIYGNGHEIHNEADLTYIGTYQMLDGELILHVFERT